MITILPPSIAGAGAAAASGAEAGAGDELSEELSDEAPPAPLNSVITLANLSWAGLIIPVATGARVGGTFLSTVLTWERTTTVSRLLRPHGRVEYHPQNLAEPCRTQ